MNAAAVRAALAELRLTQRELASLWSVSERQVRRWYNQGCRAHTGVCFDALLRLKRAGLPYRGKHEVAIGISSAGLVVLLSDAEAHARHVAIMKDGGIAP